MEPLGKVLDKGTAAGGAGLVQGNLFDVAVMDLKAFHVLAADVQDTRDLGTKLPGSAVVGEGFHFAGIGVEGRLDDIFAIPRGQGTCHIGSLRHGPVEAAHFADDDIQGRALVAAVVRVEDFLVPADGNDFRRRGAGVDAQVDRAAVRGQLAPFHFIFGVAGQEFLIFLVIVEEGQPFVPRNAVTALGLVQVLHQGGVVQDFRFLGERAADGDEVGAVGHFDDIFRLHFQRLDKPFLQFRQEGQGPAQKGDVPLDFPALGQVADGLVHDGLEHGPGNILPGRAIVHQGLDIRFGKDATAAGNGINPLRLGG